MLDQPALMPHQLDAAELGQLVSGLAATASLWAPLVRIDPEQRWYAKLFDGDHAEVWLIAWDRTQSIDLHDHGDSIGAFEVVQGTLTEHWVDGGAVGQLRQRSIKAGEQSRFAAGYVHALSNRGDQPAVTVHGYSPPLTTMRSYHPLTLRPGGELPVGPLVDNDPLDAGVLV